MKITSKNNTFSFTVESVGTLSDRVLFQHLILDGEDLNGILLSNFHFQAGSFDHSSLDNSCIENSVFEGLSLVETSFNGANLNGSSFYLVFGLFAKFVNTNLKNVKFLGGNFSYSDFSHSDLSGTMFARDNMGGEIMLCGANFSQSNIENASFSGALYDTDTVFPGGFDPEAHGLVKVENP